MLYGRLLRANGLHHLAIFFAIFRLVTKTEEIARTYGPRALRRVVDELDASLAAMSWMRTTALSIL